MSVLAIGLVAIFLALQATVVSGGTIAFVGSNSDWLADYDIYMMNDDGTGLRPFVTHSAMDHSPAFSPDGQKLAFISDRSGEWAIYIINFDGTDLHMVPNSEFGTGNERVGDSNQVNWSPDGQKLVYPASNEIGSMGVINIDGTGKTVFTTNDIGDYKIVRGMSWGLSDEIIVSLGKKPWDQNIFKYTISNDTWTQMTFDITPSHALQASVNSDGEIVFVRRASWDQLYDLYVMENQPGGPSDNLTNFEINEGAFHPQWMNGNQQVVFSYNVKNTTPWKIGIINSDGTDFQIISPPDMPLYSMFPTWAAYSCLGLQCTITGTEGDDILWGTVSDDVICGLGGNDKVFGRRGNDVICGDLGDDILIGGRGEDRLAGSMGHDTLIGNSDSDLLKGGEGDDLLHGGKGSDVLEGGEDDDYLLGGNGGDFLFGGNGNDMLRGNGGYDECFDPQGGSFARSCEVQN